MTTDRRAFLAGAICVFATPFVGIRAWSKSKLIEAELIRVGTDSMGDSMSEAVLRNAVRAAKLPLPISSNFKSKPELGKVVSLRMDQGRVLASMDLNTDGHRAWDKGHELAAGGKVSYSVGPSQQIANLDFFGAALTPDKVK